jgi:hypothetical protein
MKNFYHYNSHSKQLVPLSGLDHQTCLHLVAEASCGASILSKDVSTWATGAEHQDTGATNLAQSILDLNLPGVAPATHCLQSASTQKSADPFGAPAFDLYRIASKADLLSHEWPRPPSPISNDRRLPSGGRSIRSPSYLTMPVALTAKLVLTPRSLT